MKIPNLVKTKIGVPFYTLENGQFFQFIVFDENYNLNIQYIYHSLPILMKIDRVGAIDYPYDKEAEKNILYIDEKSIVQTIKKTQKAYKDYIKDIEDYKKLVSEYFEYNER